VTAITSVDPLTSDLVSIDVSTSDSVARISAVGEIDSTSAPVLRERLEAVLAGDVQQFVVDLVGVTFLDSAGLCVLAAAHRKAAAQGIGMQVLAASRAVIRPLQITGLWSLLGATQVEAAAGAA
jgi:anti-sigma B factor antagonist